MVAIPNQLLEAAANFDVWANDRMLRAEEQKKISEPLYHYTDAAGLKGIIDKQEIWFTGHRYLNDPSELTFGIDAAHKEIKAVSVKGGSAKCFCDRLSDLFNVHTITDELEYLLAGFSYARNDLGQWRAYGCNGRGFALGLAPHLFAVEQEKPAQKLNEKIGVYPVEYGDARARERHHEIVKKAAEIFEDTANKHKDMLQDKTVASAFIGNYIRHVMAGALIFASLTSKHEAYEHEREVRLMMLGLRTKFIRYIETRVKNDELIVFVRHPMPLIKEPGSIVEIVMGPCVGVDAEHAVRSLLNSAGIDPSVPIRPSGIPYRAR
jgi:hypothetical protein